MITSTKNEKIKEIRALQGRAKARKEAEAYVIEGVRLAEEAWAAEVRPQLALYTENLSARGHALIGKMASNKVVCEEIPEHVMEAASDMRSSQGILLVLPLRPLTQPKTLDLVLIADKVSNPGNMGTLLRSAAAAGTQAVWVTPGSVDVFSPKVVRGGMGAHFNVSIKTFSPKEIVNQAKIYNLQILATAVGEGKPYSKIDFTQPTAILIGGEAEGVDHNLMNAAELTHIPMPGSGESLNAGVAGSVVLFEVVRQRGE